MDDHGIIWRGCKNEYFSERETEREREREREGHLKKNKHSNENILITFLWTDDLSNSPGCERGYITDRGECFILIGLGPLVTEQMH